MAKINLLPTKIKEDIAYSKRNKKLTAFVFFALILLAGSGFLAGFGYLIANAQLDQIVKKRQAQERKKDDVAFIKIGDQAVNVEAESERLQRQINAIETIEKEQLFWSKVIEEIAIVTPDTIYLRNLPLSADTKTRIIFTGVAVEQIHIAAYRNALEDSKYFKHVDVQSLSNTDDSNVGNKAYSFTISMSLDDVSLFTGVKK